VGAEPGGRFKLSPLPAAAALTAAAVLLAALAAASGFGRLAEDRSLDLRFRARGTRPPAPEIVLVTVDESSFRTLGLKYPFPPALWAKLLDQLSSAGAAAVAFDFLYSEPSRECDPPDQDALVAAAAKRSGAVVWALQLRDGKTPDLPIPLIRASVAATGFINLPDERDSRIRRYQAEKDAFPSFAAATAETYAGFRPPAARGEALRLIDYRGPAGTYPAYALGDVLTGKVPLSTFSGKICLVGATFAASHDLYPTPFHRTDSPDMPGVEIHAHILAGMLAGQELLPDPAAPQWAAAALLAFLAAWAVCAGRPGLSAVLWGAGTAGWATWALLRFARGGRVALVTGPLLLIGLSVAGAVVWSYLAERAQRRAIRALFSHYLDPKVVAWLERNPEEVTLAGHRRVCTILDTDIEGFTSITEQMDPTALVAHLNNYFEVLTKCVLEHGGLHDKYVGDAVMAIFGFPLDQPDHAVRAVSCAKAFLQRLDSLNPLWEKQGLPALRTRVGISTGEVVVGNVGGTVRRTFTAMGDAANLASRLEALNKRFGTRVILSPETARHLPADVPVFDLGEVLVRGLAKPLRVYCPDFGAPEGGFKVPEEDRRGI